jgi:hypothetical protein
VCSLGIFGYPISLGRLNMLKKILPKNFHSGKILMLEKKSGSFGNCILPNNFGQMIKVKKFMYSQTFQALWKNPDAKTLGQFWNFYVAHNFRQAMKVEKVFTTCPKS